MITQCQERVQTLRIQTIMRWANKKEVIQNMTHDGIVTSFHDPLQSSTKFAKQLA